MKRNTRYTSQTVDVSFKHFHTVCSVINKNNMASEREAELEKIRRRMAKPSPTAQPESRSDPTKRKFAGDFLDEVFQHIDRSQEKYVSILAEGVAIPGVSADPARRNDVIRMVKHTESLCKALGGSTRLCQLGTQNIGGTVVPLPPVLLAQFGDDPSKKTVMIYGHLDVQPAKKSDGWSTDPFTLTEIDGKLFGRGSTDDKGPCLGWLCCIESYQKIGQPLPVNIRFVFEGMEESGSVGLPELVKSLAVPNGYLDPKKIDFCCISDNYFLGKTKPCVTHGLRGNCYFHLTIESSSKDLHSGVIGGSVHEGMIDLVHLMAKLVDSHGNILIPGINNSVRKVTPEEMEVYEKMDFNLAAYQEDAGVNGISDKLLYKTKAEILMHRWRFPTCTIHGVEGAFDGVGSKTVIPRKVIGKFSLRIVPDQTPDEIEGLVRAYLDQEWKKLNTPNRYHLKMAKGSLPWICEPTSPNFVAAKNAVVRVHGIEPDLTREGGSIPITLTFQECTESDVVLLPIGACDDMAHSQNEKIDRRNYLNGMKLFAAYLVELSKLGQKDLSVAQAATNSTAKRIKSWRRRCRKDQTRFGCECLECQ